MTGSSYSARIPERPTRSHSRPQSSRRQHDDPAQPSFSGTRDAGQAMAFRCAQKKRRGKPASIMLRLWESMPYGFSHAQVSTPMLPFLVGVSSQFRKKAQGSGPILPMNGLIRVFVVMPSGGFLRRMPSTSDVEPGRARFQEGFHGWHAVLTILQGWAISSPWPCWFWRSFSRSGSWFSTRP